MPSSQVGDSRYVSVPLHGNAPLGLSAVADGRSEVDTPLALKFSVGSDSERLRKFLLDVFKVRHVVTTQEESHE